MLSQSTTDLQKQQRNKVNNMKKFAKDNYNNNIEDMISNTDRGSKTFWQVMGRFMRKGTSDSVIPPLKMPDDNYAFTDLEKATTLNNYFCSISSVDDNNTELPFFENRTNTEITDINVLVSAIVDILSSLKGSLKVNKASGQDGISHRMLKNTCKTIAIPLCKLFNKSLQSRTYPRIWKSATVMPIFNKGDKSEVSNYRPISLISCVGKTFERVVFKHVHNYLLPNSLIYKYQSGFLPGHSTVHHLIELVHQTCLALEDRKTNCQIFCDISKAFDNIYHEGNISKMPDFDVLTLSESRKRKSRSHGIRKKGNDKRKRCATMKLNTSLNVLAVKLRMHGRHPMLSYLSSLPIAVLRSLDTEANRFYDRNHQMYDAALLTRCYTQHALRPFIDSESNHIRSFIKIPFINKGIDFIDLPSIFRAKSVIQSIPTYFQNSEPPIICYKYNKPIRNTIFNFNKLVSDLDIHANTPKS